MNLAQYIIYSFIPARISIKSLATVKVEKLFNNKFNEIERLISKNKFEEAKIQLATFEKLTKEYILSDEMQFRKEVLYTSLQLIEYLQE
jgi:hypothetical protein